jgi:hypothetical protein
VAHGFAGDQRWTLGRIKTLIGKLFHVEGRGVARYKSTARDLSAFICFEDEAGQGLRPRRAVPGPARW